jgi:alpha-L-fucosidase
MKNTVTLFLIFCTFLNIQLVSAQNDGRTAWFEEARFGMFIHWGLYSAAEGLWKGEKLRYVNNYAEWIRYRNRISKEEYGELAKRFVWDRINPEEWVIQAKEAGMKYIVMTSKHHDGVALWDTKVGNYSLSKLAGVDRDIIKELADACRKHDMKLGFYYSHWIDWEHPFAWDHNQELTGHVTDAQFNQYWQEKAIPQLRELLTNYGDIAVMWFDMWIPYEKTIFKREQLEQAAALIRELQPNCLINSRLGFPAESEYVDFETLGDNVFGTAYTDHPWETPGTIAHSWGFSSQEKEWKSTSQLFQSLIGNVSLNGGYTLNIGPRADGSIPYESVSRLREIGEWTKKYGEALYNNTGSGLRAHQHDWGEVTRSQMDNVLYLHVMNWPLDRVLRVSGVQNQPTKVELLTNKGKQLLSYEQQGPLLHINLPENSVDPYDSVIKLSCSNDITIDRNIVAESTFGGFSLQNQNVLNAKDLKILKYDGKRPARIVSNGETAEWEVYFPRTGAYKLDLSAHNPSGTAVSIEVHIGSQVVQAQLQPDGKVVAEPNENNYTDEFVDRHLQEFKITKTGKQKVTFRVVDQQPIWLNRIWIEHKK